MILTPASKNKPQRRRVNSGKKSAVKFIDSPAFRGQQVDHRTLMTETFVIKTDASGTAAYSIPVRLDYLTQWKHWAEVFEEYRIVSVTAELLPYQGSTTKGLTCFWWDTGLTPDAPTSAQAVGRTSSFYRNSNMSKRPILLNYTFKEIEDLKYEETTNASAPFGTVHFTAYTDAPLFDSPNDTFLFMLRFRYQVVFKTLRVLE
jgi:hypothetical protein